MMSHRCHEAPLYRWDLRCPAGARRRRERTGRGGGWTFGAVTLSSAVKNSSAPTRAVTFPEAGSTHGKSLGSPEYRIWSHRMVSVGPMDIGMQGSVTTWNVFRGAKHPPHACARAGAASVTNPRTAETTESRIRARGRVETPRWHVRSARRTPGVRPNPREAVPRVPKARRETRTSVCD